MKNITVIGSGTMGNGIAHVFAQNGYNVSLVDINEAALKKAVDTISKNLDRQITKGALTEDQKASTLANITTFTKLEEGAGKADLVVEAATENMNIKLDIFRQLDQLAPAHCILASNTSSISITKIASVTKRPEKVIGMHFMNPVPVMKLVEVINGYKTDRAITSQIIELSKNIGKIPAYFLYVGSFGSAQNFLSMIPVLNKRAYLQTYYHEIDGIFQLKNGVGFITSFGYESIIGNNQMNKGDNIDGKLGSIQNNPVNQQSTLYGIGLDVKLNDNLNLYMRHRLFSQKDKSFTKDRIEGTETSIELKLFF